MACDQAAILAHPPRDGDGGRCSTASRAVWRPSCCSSTSASTGRSWPTTAATHCGSSARATQPSRGAPRGAAFGRPQQPRLSPRLPDESDGGGSARSAAQGRGRHLGGAAAGAMCTSGTTASATSASTPCPRPSSSSLSPCSGRGSASADRRRGEPPDSRAPCHQCTGSQIFRVPFWRDRCWQERYQCSHEEPHARIWHPDAGPERADQAA